MLTEGPPDSAERYRRDRRATAKAVAEAKLRNGKSLEMSQKEIGAGSPKDALENRLVPQAGETSSCSSLLSN